MGEVAQESSRGNALALQTIGGADLQRIRDSERSVDVSESRYSRDASVTLARSAKEKLSSSGVRPLAYSDANGQNGRNVSRVPPLSSNRQGVMMIFFYEDLGSRRN